MIKEKVPQKIPGQEGSLSAKGEELLTLRAKFFAAYKSLRDIDDAALPSFSVARARGDELQHLQDSYARLKELGYPLSRLLKEAKVRFNRDDVAKYLNEEPNF